MGVTLTKARFSKAVFTGTYTPLYRLISSSKKTWKLVLDSDMFIPFSSFKMPVQPPGGAGLAARLM